MESMVHKITKVTAGHVVLMAVLVLTGRAGTWVLANGDQLTGELLAEDAAFVEVQHPQLGRLKLARSVLQASVGAKPVAARAETASPAAKPLGTAVQPEIENWKRQMDIGYSQQSGAKEKQDLSVRLQVDGKEGANTFRGTARLLEAEADDKTVTDRREADFRWRYDINKRLFAQALTTYAADDVRKIDLSLEQQIGGGFRVIDSSRHKANVGLGAVVQYLDRTSTDQQTALLGSLFQDYAYQWNNRVKLVQESSFMLSDTGALSVKSGVASAPAEGSYRLKFNTGVQSKVTNSMSLNVRFEYDYDRSVLESELRADQRLTTSLGYFW
jgi:putative salt-induced outer membrane protein YdiY